MLGVPFDTITTSEDNAATDGLVMSVTQRIATGLPAKNGKQKLELVI